MNNQLPRALPGTGAGPRRGKNGRFEPLREQISQAEFDAESARVKALYAARDAASKEQLLRDTLKLLTTPHFDIDETHLIKRIKAALGE